MGKFLLTLVRHGETEYNLKGLLQGQSDIPLNESGLQQADALGRHLARERFDRMYSSDLSRCLQTAAGVVKHAEVTRPDIVQDARLRERSFGSHEGLSREERAQASLTDPHPPGAETVKQVVNRGLAFLRDMCKDVHAAYDQNGELKSAFQAEHRPIKRGESTNASDTDPGFEVVFVADSESAVGSGIIPPQTTKGNDAASNSTRDEATSVTQNVTSGTKTTNTVANTTQNHIGGAEVNNPASSATPDGIDGTVVKEMPVNTASSSSSNNMASPGSKDVHVIFKSHITGVYGAPPNCPHIFVSSHGFILRAVMQELQRKFKIDIPGGAGKLRQGCPNTAVNSFIIEVDGSGDISDIECQFVFNTEHLDIDASRR